MRLLVVAIAAVLLTACSLQNAKLYDGPDRSPSEVGVISSLGLYGERRLTLAVTAINGQAVDTTRTASFQVLPGSHEVTIHAMKDLNIQLGAMAYTSNYKEANVVVRLNVHAGHSYIPNAVVANGRISVFFEDKGTNYPKECLPLYKFINGANAPLGSGLYSTGERCGL
jgi:hypothetical protein